MTTLAEPTRCAAVAEELDLARRRGPLQTIIIPPCPALLARLQRALGAAEPDLPEVARIAAGDVAMSATLLRAANAPMYAAGQPVQTIGQAMNRLGLAQTAAVLTGFIAQRALPVRNPQLQRFWERSTKRALALAFIARKLPGMSPDVAHTFGLFCHVGLPVMLQSLKGYAGTMVEARARTDRSFIATENANHRTDHAVVGALVARVWRLSPTVVAAVRLHHDLDLLGDQSVEPEVQTLIAAGLLAEHLMLRHEGLDADRDWADHAPRALGWLELDADDLLVWEDELRETLDAA
ncbi:MAG: HDOD domain-containing protein [Burkholderiales bacterium]|nr:HDOD domain-containing protein [Burkholderiales bacterium]